MNQTAIDNQPILQSFLAYRPCPDLNRSTRLANLDYWGLPREAGDLLLNDPNAYFYSCFFNYQVPAVRALCAPFELRRRLGHLEPHRIAKMSWKKLAEFTGSSKHGSCLHRFPTNVAKRIVEASEKLVAEFGGNAANIWPEGARASDVIARLLAFKGIKQKRANMSAILLVKAFGVHLTGWEDIDVAVDRHVARVFLRTGIVHRENGWHSVGEVADQVIQAARDLLPVFPGHLDVAFEIGLEWCTAKESYCDYAPDPCPLRSCCKRRTGVHIA